MSNDDIETTSRSIVSRLDPALRKALLKALSNLEIESATEEASSTTASTLPSEQLLEQSTAADLQALNLYNQYIVNGANYTQKTKDDNEIIHTIIVKAPKSIGLRSEEKEADPNDQVVIRFDHPDPVKESDVRVETLQIPRSVKTNEIDDEIEVDNNSDQATTYHPSTTSSSITTTDALPTTAVSTTTTTTTPAPTHNEDGENIENVAKSDVKIFAAPLVAAFTVHQDERGQPKNVIPLLDALQPSPISARPVQEFSLPLTSTNKPFDVNGALSTPSALSLAKSLELPSTQEATFSSFAQSQKQRQLEDQIVFLQKQHREREEVFRQQQVLQEQQAVNRQQQLLLQQRYRYEEENRLRLQRYEQEQRLIRQQHQLQTLPTLTFEPSFTPINRFASPSSSQSSSIQIIPSLSFAPVQVPTQQLLPVRDQVDFRPKTSSVDFQTRHQSLDLLPPPLPQGLSLPIPNDETSQSRHRVFRQETGTGNVGLNSVNTNFPPFSSQSFDVDGQLQNLLFRSGFGDVRANEDLNIISKVLSLNHGIPTRTDALFPPNTNFISGRFARSADIESHQKH